jgi:hypothetical protein
MLSPNKIPAVIPQLTKHIFRSAISELVQVVFLLKKFMILIVMSNLTFNKKAQPVRQGFF